MATNQPALKKDNFGGQAAQGRGEWNEEQLEEALKRLKLLHIKARPDHCRELRSTMPRMLEPLTTKHTSRQDVLVSFQTAMASAATEIQNFRTLYTSEESQRVLEQARKSREAQPKGIKPWRARDHPDWLDLEEQIEN
ncbi:hypothetical protein BJ170DRAFT_682466 [Xylariales sp. AK1849]|nr:hypothetical protein BJ170DRAFT_682466 [Xylariales sp. AK1849]